MSYNCYICGKSYNNPVEAADCTMKCDKLMKSIQEKEQKFKERLREQELDCLRTTIMDTYNKLRDLCKEYTDKQNDIVLDVVMESQFKDFITTSDLNSPNTNGHDTVNIDIESNTITSEDERDDTPNNADDTDDANFDLIETFLRAIFGNDD